MLEEVIELKKLLRKKEYTSGTISYVREAILTLISKPLSEVTVDYLEEIVKLKDMYNSYRKNFNYYGKESRFTKDITLNKAKPLKIEDLLLMIKLPKEDHNRFKDLQRITEGKFDMLQFNLMYSSSVLSYYLCTAWRWHGSSKSNRLAELYQYVNKTKGSSEALSKYIDQRRFNVLVYLAKIYRNHLDRLIEKATGSTNTWIPDYHLREGILRLISETIIELSTTLKYGN